MKILLINEVCGIGSTGRICTDLALMLDSQGNEVKIAYGRNDDVPKQFQKYAVRIGTDFDVILHALKTRLLDASGFGSKRVTMKFINWVIQYDPDVIHLHNLHGYYINIEVLFEYLKICGKRIIWTLHDYWAFTGHSAYCDAVKCEKWKNGCGKCPQLSIYPKAYVDRSRLNWSKKRELFTGIRNLTIVTPSNWLADSVRQSYLKEYPVTVIHNGIDTSKFHYVQSTYKEKKGLEGKKILLSVATVWNDLKGYSDFIKLANRLDNEYLIILVGGMTGHQKKALPSNICHIDRIQNVDEMNRLYNIADAYINLTYCDTYPTVNIEAFACGTPVITYAVGGSTESAEKYGGVVIERGNIELVADWVKKTKSLKVTVGDSRILDKRYSTEKYLELYRGIV